MIFSRKPNYEGFNRSFILEMMGDQVGSETTLENNTKLPNITSESTQPLPPNQTEAEDLSGGAVAGIVIGVVIAILIILGVLFFLYKRRLLPGRSRKQDTVIFSFDTSFQNLIDCSDTSRRESDRRSYTSSRASNTTRSSIPKTSDTPSNYTPSSTLPSSASYPSNYTPSSGSYTTSNNPHYRPSTDDYTQSRNNYERSSSPTYIPSSNYTQNRLNYNPYSLNYTPNSLYYTPRDYSASSFNYRPSRHIDRQLMAYYNWTIREESIEPRTAHVHQPSVYRDSRRK